MTEPSAAAFLSPRLPSPREPGAGSRTGSSEARLQSPHHMSFTYTAFTSFRSERPSAPIHAQFAGWPADGSSLEFTAAHLALPLPSSGADATDQTIPAR